MLQTELTSKQSPLESKEQRQLLNTFSKEQLIERVVELTNQLHNGDTGESQYQKLYNKLIKKYEKFIDSFNKLMSELHNANELDILNGIRYEIPFYILDNYTMKFKDNIQSRIIDNDNLKNINIDVYHIEAIFQWCYINTIDIFYVGSVLENIFNLYENVTDTDYEIIQSIYASLDDYCENAKSLHTYCEKQYKQLKKRLPIN